MSSSALPRQSVEQGQVWLVRKTGECWEVTGPAHDAASAWRVVRLDALGRRTKDTDAVFAGEITSGARLVRAA